MQARSAAGRKILAETHSAPVALNSAQERTVRVTRPSKDARLGFRLGLHPISGQVIIVELYLGYPAIQTGRLFVGDVVTRIDGVAVTDVDMALQLIRLSGETVELQTTNVYAEAVKASAQPRAPTVPHAGAGLGQQGAAPPAALPAGTNAAAGPPMVATSSSAPEPNLMDGDLMLNDSDFFKQLESPSIPSMAVQTASKASHADLAQQIVGLYPSNASHTPPPQPPATASSHANRPQNDPWASSLIQF